MFEQLSTALSVVYKGFEKIRTICLLALMPLYLFFIYIKLDDTSAMSYALVMTIIFVLYLPIQIIASEKGIPISFHMIYEDEHIMRIVANAFLFVIAFVTVRFAYDIGLILLYVSWLLMQIQLFNIFKNANIVNKSKMLFVFIPIIVIISYATFSSFSGLSFSFNIETVAILFFIVFNFLIIMVILFPWLLIVFLSVFFRRISINVSSNITFDGVVYSFSALITGYMFSIYLTNSIVQSINPVDMAFYTVYGFILLSALGGYFQFKLFWSYFLDESLSWIATIVSLLVFTVVLIIIVNTQGLVEKRVLIIQDSQKSFGKFYDKHLR